LKCKKFVLNILIIIISFSTTFFVRNIILIKKLNEYQYDLDNVVEIYESKAVVKDCYTLSRNDIYKTAIFINSKWKDLNIHNRSVESIVSEIELHKVLYNLGMFKSHTIDADIESTKDERLIVRISYKIIQILGI
jgi:hypothetical protein